MRAMFVFGLARYGGTWPPEGVRGRSTSRPGGTLFVKTQGAVIVKYSYASLQYFICLH